MAPSTNCLVIIIILFGLDMSILLEWKQTYTASKFMLSAHSHIRGSLETCTWSFRIPNPIVLYVKVFFWRAIRSVGLPFQVIVNLHGNLHSVFTSGSIHDRGICKLLCILKRKKGEMFAIPVTGEGVLI